MSKSLRIAPVYTKKRPAVPSKKFMSVLITLAVSYGYSLRGVVWCAVAKEAEKMRNTLEDLYYGNITPGTQQMAPNSELKRAVDRVTRFESQLTERLDETGQSILAKLIESEISMGNSESYQFRHIFLY